MAEFKWKGYTNKRQDRRIYFTCHPDDFDLYFSKIREDISKTHKCAFIYTEDMSEAITDEEKETCLSGCNLFVVPVTEALLTTPNRAMDEDIPFAIQNGIRVLPIAMEGGLDALYSQPDKFGTLQYLNAYSNDSTEVPYEYKLKSFLESVLISDELAERVRAAFDAYVFLSYRKKDRRYANELMRMIQQNPECRSIAIWFDEFLIPGENFEENLKNLMDKCHLFALLVTPRLLEKVVDENGMETDNYVLAHELPYAREKQAQKGVDIFAVEMETTDRQALAAIDINDYVNGYDEAFRTRLLETVSKLAIQENDSPEHNFLIGLAYLEGIDVVTDRQRGIQLITGAADAGLPEAMHKLLHMTRNTLRPIPHEEAVRALGWAKKLVEHAVAEYGEEHIHTLDALQDLAYAYGHAVSEEVLWARICHDSSENDPELVTWKKVLDLSNRILGDGNKYSFSALQNIARIQGEEYGNADAELQTLTLSYEQSKKANEHAYRTDVALYNLVHAYQKRGRWQEALCFCKERYGAKCDHFGTGSSQAITALDKLVWHFQEAGDTAKQHVLAEIAYMQSVRWLHKKQEQTESSLRALSLATWGWPYHRQLKLEELVYRQECALLGEDDPQTFSTLKNLARLHGQMTDYAKEKELFEKLYRLKCKVLGENDPRTIETLGYLAWCYKHLGDSQNEVAMLERQYEAYHRVLGDADTNTRWAWTQLEDARSGERPWKEFPAPEPVVVTKEEILAVIEEVFGDMPTTRIALCNQLALIYRDAEDFSMTLALLRTVYELRCETLGAEHPNTIKTLRNIAFVHGKLENYQESARCLETAYEVQCRTLGETHPDALRTMRILARAWERAEEYPKALDLNQKGYALSCQLNGVEHLDTLDALIRLADTYEWMEDWEQVLPLREQAYALSCKLNGEEHLDTLDAIDDLVYSYINVKNFPAALEFAKKAYALSITLKGEEHPDTEELWSVVKDLCFLVSGGRTGD